MFILLGLVCTLIAAVGLTMLMLRGQNDRTIIYVVGCTALVLMADQVKMLLLTL